MLTEILREMVDDARFRDQERRQDYQRDAWDDQDDEFTTQVAHSNFMGLDEILEDLADVLPSSVQQKMVDIFVSQLGVQSPADVYVPKQDIDMDELTSLAEQGKFGSVMKIIDSLAVSKHEIRDTDHYKDASYDQAERNADPYAVRGLSRSDFYRR